jgi:hypothetical protein
MSSPAPASTWSVPRLLPSGLRLAQMMSLPPKPTIVSDP